MKRVLLGTFNDLIEFFFPRRAKGMFIRWFCMYNKLRLESKITGYTVKPLRRYKMSNMLL